MCEKTLTKAAIGRAIPDGELAVALTRTANAGTYAGRLNGSWRLDNERGPRLRDRLVCHSKLVSALAAAVEPEAKPAATSGGNQ